jgi:flagellar hook protein FlgE
MGFSTALSGLKAASTTLSVTGNNIANSQTAGFKESRAQFGDVYTNSLGSSGASAVGAGARVSSVAQQFKQGNIEPTGNALDLAISGEGFFAMGDLVDPIIPDKPLEATSYTRNGAFHINNAGNVVDDNGRYLLAFKPTGATVAEGFDVGVKLPLLIKTDQGAPTPTTNVDMKLNLNGSAKPAVTPFAFTTPGTAPYIPDPKTYTHTTSITTYDVLGNAHIVSTYFSKTAVPNEWDAYTFIDGRSLQPGVQEDVYAIPPVVATGAVALPEGTITTQPTKVMFDDKGNLTKLSPIATTGDLARSAAALAKVKYNAAAAEVVSKQEFVKQAEAVFAAATASLEVASAVPQIDGVVPAQVTAAEEALARAQSSLDAANNALVVVTDNKATLKDDYDMKTDAVNTAEADEVLAAAEAAAAGKTAPKSANTKVDFGAVDISAINPDLKVSNMSFSIDFVGSTQFSTPFTVNDLRQDGLPVGNLTGVDVDKTGVIFAKYSNGFAKPIGQVALARFSSNQDLAKVGNTTWLATSDSGAPIYGAGGDNNFGQIRSSSIENSNVDLSEQLVKLIVAQQAYQANSQTVTTEKTIIDTMLRI